MARAPGSRQREQGRDHRGDARPCPAMDRAQGIRVNALAPGFFPSEMTAEYPDGYLEAMLPRVPAGRSGDPSELAAVAVFLASDAASYITGVVLPVDGGPLTG